MQSGPPASCIGTTGLRMVIPAIRCRASRIAASGGRGSVAAGAWPRSSGVVRTVVRGGYAHRRCPVARRHVAYTAAMHEDRSPALPDRTWQLDARRVRSVAQQIAPHIRHTPLIPIPSGGWLKLESLQPTGSFKVRGFFAAALAIAAERRACGLMTVSAG